MSIFEGAGVALVTPFTQDGVNFDTLKKMIDFQIDGGIDSILLCGTTGEPATMTESERKAVIEEGIKYINGRVPVIAGAGSNCTAAAVEMSKFCESVGADAILQVTPYYNKCSQAGLIKHYEAIMDSVSKPVVVYNVPSRTGVNVKPETLAAIAEHENCAAIKEASGDIVQVAEMCRLCSDKMDIISGNDDQIVPLMSVGGKGVISVLANICPGVTHDIVASYLAGDVKKASDIQLEYLPLIKALFSDVNPIPVKTALRLMGFEVGPLRLPLCDMSPAAEENLKNVMKGYGLI